MIRNYRSMFTLSCGLLLLANAHVNAETLVLEFDTRATPAEINVPEEFSDVNESFAATPGSGEFTIRLILSDFERYATGTHEIPLNIGNGLNWGPNADQSPVIQTAGLTLTLESRLLGMLEGVRTRVQAENSAGETFGGAVLLPDESQIADYGSVTISDGAVTGFTYGWVEADNPGLVSMNNVLVGRQDLPVGMLALTVDVSAFTEPARFGDIVLVKGLAPAVRVDMGPVDIAPVE